MATRTYAAEGGRTLIHIPIVHSQADMGTLADRVQRETTRRHGVHGWERHIALVNQVWSDIETLCENLALDYQQVRLYQDGLPICERESDIVKDLARAGSRNHTLLLHFMEKGATLMGTECPELLLEEYRLLKRSLEAKGGGNEHQRQALASSLLQNRDKFIAERINLTLCKGETGILFLGMLHSLEGLLQPDIRLVMPLVFERDKRDERDESEKVHELR